MKLSSPNPRPRLAATSLDVRAAGAGRCPNPRRESPAKRGLRAPPIHSPLRRRHSPLAAPGRPRQPQPASERARRAPSGPRAGAGAGASSWPRRAQGECRCPVAPARPPASQGAPSPSPGGSPAAPAGRKRGVGGGAERGDAPGAPPPAGNARAGKAAGRVGFGGLGRASGGRALGAPQALPGRGSLSAASGAGGGAAGVNGPADAVS